MRKILTNLKFKIAIVGIVVLIGIVLPNFAVATTYPSYNNEIDCRGCHGGDTSNRHHQLVVNGTYQCTDCHPILYNNVTQTYYSQMIRNCLVCHPGESHTQIHHQLVQQGLFQCSDCHPVIFDNQSQTYSTQVTWDCTVCHSTVLSIQNGVPIPTSTPTVTPTDTPTSTPTVTPTDTPTSTPTVTPTPTPTATPTPTPNPGPTIIRFAPISYIVNIVGDYRIFNITTDQIVNMKWYINGRQIQFNNNVTYASYVNTSASFGVWNVSVVASNINGTVTYYWSWNVSRSIVNPPVILSYSPLSPVNDFTGTSRKFGITINQVANIAWYINGRQVQLNKTITGASYTNTSPSIGIWNVSAIASNIYGYDIHIWTWNVASKLTLIRTKGSPISDSKTISLSQGDYSIMIDNTNLSELAMMVYDDGEIRKDLSETFTFNSWSDPNLPSSSNWADPNVALLSGINFWHDKSKTNTNVVVSFSGQHFRYDGPKSNTNNIIVDLDVQKILKVVFVPYGGKGTSCNITINPVVHY